jgi:sporulation protein YlmC with PRC-barrel domain
MMEPHMLKKIAIASVIALAAASTSYAQSTTTGVGSPASAQTMNTLPPNTSTVTNWYKQNVYDPSDTKIGEISDVLIGNDGKIESFMVAVGGFLGMNEKDVAVPFSAIHGVEKNGKWWLTMNTTKDALKSASGYKYDKAKGTWVPA